MRTLERIVMRVDIYEREPELKDMPIITRIFCSRKECRSKPYFVGQRKIMEGRLAGCFENVTEECDNRDKAEKMLMKWKHDQI